MTICEVVLPASRLWSAHQHVIQHMKVAERLDGREACSWTSVAGQFDLTVLMFKALPAVTDLGDGEVDAPLCQTQTEASEEGFVALALLVQLVDQTHLLYEGQHGKRVRFCPPLVGLLLIQVHGVLPV